MRLHVFSRHTMRWVCGIGTTCALFNVEIGVWNHHPLVAGGWVASTAVLAFGWYVNSTASRGAASTTERPR